MENYRRNGWTPARQLTFLGALARTGCVARAARAAGMSRESAYRLRARDSDGLFAACWDGALKRAKGHNVEARKPRPKRRQVLGLGWKSIKSHELYEPLFSPSRDGGL